MLNQGHSIKVCQEDSVSRSIADCALETLPKRDIDGDANQHNIDIAAQYPSNYAVSRAGTSPLDMSSLASGLPDYVYQAQQHIPYAQHISPTGPHSNMMYPYQQAQYSNLQSANFGMPYVQQPLMQPYPGQQMYPSYSGHLPGPGTIQAYPGQMMYAPQMIGQSPGQAHFQQLPHNVPFAQVPGGAYVARGKGQHQTAHVYSGQPINQLSRQVPSPGMLCSMVKFSIY